MGMILAPHLIGPLGLYGINNAALFDGSTGYLSRTFGTPSDNKKWTVSVWCQRSKLTSAYMNIISAVGPGGLEFNATSDYLNIFDTGTSVITSQAFRDPAAFVMLTIAYDSAQSTAANRLKAYVNLTQVTAFSTETYPALNTDSYVNSAVAHYIGAYPTPSYYFCGYLANFYFIDGQALTPSDFGKVSATTGNWIANKYSGTYGTNGFYLDFSNAGALGTDASGNGNDWTANGTITQVPSTPTNVYPIYNFAAKSPGGIALSNGGRTATSSITAYSNVPLTFAMPTSGVHYWEIDISQTTYGTDVGFRKLTETMPITAGALTWVGYSADSYSLTIKPSGPNIQRFNNNVSAGNVSTAAQSAGHRFGIVYNADLNCCYMHHEGTWLNSATKAEIEAGTTTHAMWTSLPADLIFCFSGYNTVASTIYMEEADWNHSGIVPSNAVALCTDNLPAMTASDQNVDNHFKTVLYTGDGTGSGRAITGVGFQPDFLIGKPRSLAYTWNWFDAARGTAKKLRSDATAAEETNTIYGYLSSFDSDGFTTVAGSSDNSNWNTTGATHVAFCASLPSTKTSGWAGSPTITPSKEIYNTDLGMSIVTYTGNGTAGATIPYSLGKKPGMIIIKNKDSAIDYWVVYHSDLGATKYLFLNTTAAASTGTVVWNDTEPTATLITLGSGSSVNTLNDTYVAYIFAESDFIKIGSYVGNGSADGPMVTKNLSPIWGIWKGSSLVSSWDIFDAVRDTYNPIGGRLYPNLASAESTGTAVLDFTATGAKLRNGGITDTNQNAATYVYLMIGQPTGGRNASEATAR